MNQMTSEPEPLVPIPNSWAMKSRHIVRSKHSVLLLRSKDSWAWVHDVPLMFMKDFWSLRSCCRSATSLGSLKWKCRLKGSSVMFPTRKLNAAMLILRLLASSDSAAVYWRVRVQSLDNWSRSMKRAKKWTALLSVLLFKNRAYGPKAKAFQSTH